MEKIENLLLFVPLYKKDSFTSSDHSSLFELKYFKGTIDFFCPHCNSFSTFQGTQKELDIGYKINSYNDLVSAYQGGQAQSRINQFIKNQFYYVHLECTRNRAHKALFTFDVTDSTIEKIGQQPSLASMHTPDLSKYKPVLSKEKLKELNKAIGLTTHGVGAGAFVYLRRIFEELLEDAHSIAQKVSNWDEEKFQRSRINERIKLLENHIPELLYKNKVLYGILSKGIHELSEDECLEYFPIMKGAIELILNEKLEKLKKTQKEEEINKALGRIQSKIK